MMVISSPIQLTPPIAWQGTPLSTPARPDALVQRRAAVAALYETHFERVARYIAVRIGDITEAEDLASEVFLRAVRSAATFQETGAPMEAWIFRIAHNIVVDHHRRRSRRPASVPLDEADPLPAKGTPADALERKQEIAEVRAAVAHLSEAQQKVVALRFGGELTSEEVARILGKKPGAVREMQSAAVKKLRQLLEGRGR
jgi:RNA polymerase sigma-70 factor (ECF subfamily)